mmetsp:Transcript_15072/g.45543  ORF Transcript_15072/g.45543 Transcript_15072/m.45543 type:complete len:230 (+) Transcript_15072:431-1120(+)|eukprot:CAMPEP_0206146640 /NCGR_PEP_ID=MMETSP1473-20131121/30995_1 /ASSEMBLY_ACC=CAM_ASM_001109 /TAXON_ID=1461547 /ORGANISM="Stichococcus sp, Strain RCC1054" /LENGTH=229 /DNA_ID=CAMNT_0053543265 /DNA_START=408 /DNA_END=1097 /DNA_ORIENTATION=-
MTFVVATLLCTLLIVGAQAARPLGQEDGLDIVAGSTMHRHMLELTGSYCGGPDQEQQVRDYAAGLEKGYTGVMTEKERLEQAARLGAVRCLELSKAAPCEAATLRSEVQALLGDKDLNVGDAAIIAAEQCRVDVASGGDEVRKCAGTAGSVRRKVSSLEEQFSGQMSASDAEVKAAVQGAQQCLKAGKIIPCAGSALIKDVTVFLEYYDAPEAALRAAASCKAKSLLMG